MGNYSRFWLSIFFVLGIGTVFGQNRYVAHFSDKNGTPFSIQSPEEFLSARALARRTAQGIAVKEEDLPVNPAYVAAIAETGAKVYYTTKWLNGVLFEATDQQVAAVKSLSQVDSIVYVAKGPLKTLEDPMGEPAAISGREQKDPANAGQRSMLGIDIMHARGYRGEGILIAVMDGGFEGVDQAARFNHIISNDHVQDTYDFVGNRTYPYGYDDHGTRVLSTLAGVDKDSTYVGNAFNANYLLYVTEDVPVEYRLEEYNWLFAAEKADSAGTDIIHSSVGYSDGFSDFSMDYTQKDMDGKTTVIAKAGQLAFDRGILVVTSAGNSGRGSWGIVTSPADVADVLAVGAVTSSGDLVDFSSRGPNTDDPIKPDVVAWGFATSIINDKGNIVTGNGTSYAAPQVAGLAAGLWQAFPELTAEDLLQAIRFSGDQWSTPDSLFGRGIANFVRAERFIVTSLDEELSNALHVYPNPIEGARLFLELSENFKVGERVTVYCYNEQGQQISTERYSVSGNPLVLDSSAWTSGRYLLRIQSAHQIAWARLIKP